MTGQLWAQLRGAISACLQAWHVILHQDCQEAGVLVRGDPKLLWRSPRSDWIVIQPQEAGVKGVKQAVQSSRCQAQAQRKHLQQPESNPCDFLEVALIDSSASMTVKVQDCCCRRAIVLRLILKGTLTLL
jgi:uncharacterized Fe-S cluster protein YjdI